MNDVDNICCHTDPFIHRYLWDAATMHSKDIHLRPFLYNFDIFSSYSNPRHVSSADVTSSHNTVPILPTLSIFYHYPIGFSSELSTSPFAIINSPSPSISVSPDNITWLSFEFVLNSVEDHLQSWPGGIVKHFIFVTDPLHFRIATYFHSNFIPISLRFHIYFITFTISIIVTLFHLLLPLVLNQVLTEQLVSFLVINHVITAPTLMLWHLY